MPLSLKMETHDAADREHAWRHHGVILFAMVMVLLLLVIESRRYRFFDLYRTRVRSLERHYYAQVFSPATEVDPDWTRILSNDLRKPDLLINLGEAFSRRLRRNYCWMFIILLFAWLLKSTSLQLKPDGGLYSALRRYKREGEFAYGDAHV